tara:strand:+ start:141 stop:590 length:450 start_codon:yes stop_codon:yes gene_type:complete
MKLITLLQKKRFKYTIVLLICFCIYSYTTYNSSNLTHYQSNPKLPAKSTIKNQLKVDIQPLIVSELHPTKIQITIESTQNPDLSQLNIIKSMLLSNENQIPYQPTNWTPISQDKYHQQGIVTFPPLPKNSKLLSITLFEYDERNFSWQL